MVTTAVRTRQGVYYVENETVRALIVIVSEIGLALDRIHRCREALTNDLVHGLEAHALRVVQLALEDGSGSTLTNGHGLWNFYVYYGASGNGCVALPVESILTAIRESRWAFAAARSYHISLWMTAGTYVRAYDSRMPGYWVRQLPPGWETSAPSGASATRIGQFGWDPLSVSITRQ